MWEAHENWGLNPGPCSRPANAIPLSYNPDCAVGSFKAVETDAVGNLGKPDIFKEKAEASDGAQRVTCLPGVPSTLGLIPRTTYTNCGAQHSGGKDRRFRSSGSSLAT